MVLLSILMLQTMTAPEFFNGPELLDFVARFAFNFIVAYIIIRWLYYPIHQNKDYLFTYFLFNLIIFLLCYMMKNTQLEIGVAFGLFAVFSILRYRTLNVSVVDMAYLFVMISVGVINSLSNENVSVAQVLAANVFIVIIIYVMEKVWLVKHAAEKVVEYEKIENIRPENQHKLIEDLKERTGLNVYRVEIGKVDFTRDVATIRIFYFE